MLGLRLIDDAEFIIARLNESGYEAYAVGGCVRDAVMGRQPKDWDITTSAAPDEVRRVFSRTVNTGGKHGTITVLIKNKAYEVTTYRVDGKYSDGRRPDIVTYTSTLAEDLGRRDFTINAIAYHYSEGFVDPFGGIGDIEKRIIRTVGRPDERFGEDSLRMLRALRFRAQLGFEIESETYASIIRNSALIEKISAERIRDEILKILLSASPQGIMSVVLTGLMDYCYPRAAEYLRENADKILPALTAGGWEADPASNAVNRLTLLLCFMPESQAAELLRGMRFDTKTIRAVSLRVRELSEKDSLFSRMLSNPSLYYVRKAMSRLNAGQLTDCLAVAEIFNRVDHGLRADIETTVGKITAAGNCLNLSNLAINGRDLIKAGFKPGKPTGDALNAALDAVLRDPALNTKPTLLKLTLELLNARNGPAPSDNPVPEVKIP
ncbi:MAG: CCA tRNA nucleotidyltransferase [Clostridiales bacterium]|nr:CCA tRNA nucleotidyltransferase [Clostridiales bacterium]